jgi:hypothetical protein
MDYYKKYNLYKYKYINLKQKYLCIGGNKDDIIPELLQILTGTFSGSGSDVMNNIKIVYENLKKYVSTPWNSKTKQLYNIDEYNKERNEKKDVNCTTDPNEVLCQFHSGNLIEHSQWSAIYIIKFINDNAHIVQWITQKNKSEQQFYLNFAIICAFFHDIGKGLDCIYDLYDRDKFPDGNDALHTVYSGDAILKKKLMKNCITPSEKKDIDINEIIKFLINKVLEKYQVSVPIDTLVKIVALTSYLHWDFGKINIGNKEDEQKRITKYVNDFISQCEEIDLKPNKEYLSLCILINCVDTLASSKPVFTDIKPLDEKYLGKNPWTLFKMNINYEKYYDGVLETFDKVASK